MSNNPGMLSIQELFSSGDRYTIPLYQRNYAWEHFHLQQLIQDIWDCCLHAPKRHYYIGTLVVYRTLQDAYEVIDGQQRLTTINIMLCAMKNKIEKVTNPYSWFQSVNIIYEFREKASTLLNRLYENAELSSGEDDYIYNMYNSVRETMESVFRQEASQGKYDFFECFERFKNYFFDHVIITRVMLPSDTDRNHYFEIMNTRGEQLEKHEILKARILESLGSESRALWLGNRIWEACADMNRYVQLGFADTELRKHIFSNDLNTLAAPDFDALVVSASQYAIQDCSSSSLLEIINGRSSDAHGHTGATDTHSDRNDESRFNSVVNFPNFLLHVLRVMTRTDIPLDDKRLLEIFEPQLTAAFARNFLYQLLKVRFLFDKYIIKRDFLSEREDGKWTISEFHENYSYTRSFDKEQQKNIMIQSMFHVSLPSQNYKHWLCAALLYLSEHNDGKGLYDYLLRLSQAYMLDRFIQPGGDQLDYFTIIFKNDGVPVHQCPRNLTLPRFDTGIDIFYFNYLDMQLWLHGYEPDFTFSLRSSVEHFYPQHPMENFESMNDRYLHSFGNLCLISRSKNSRLSNFSPIQKTEFYKNSSIDSIKQKIMMNICEENHGWTTSDIVVHERSMKEVLLKSLTQ